jgi:hypothetical protein
MNGDIDRQRDELRPPLQSAPAEHGSSNTPGPYPPASLARPSASQATMAETSRRKGKERMRPDPPPSSLFSATIDTPPAVRTGFDHPAANTPANVPDREQGVKTPGGHHLRPEIKKQIFELSKQNFSPPQIAQQITGLSRKQAAEVIRSADPDQRQMRQAGKVKLAKAALGTNATPADYRRMRTAQRAQKRTGRAAATAAEYHLLLRGEQAVRELGPGAKPYDLDKLQKAELNQAKVERVDVSEIRARRRPAATSVPDASTAPPAPLLELEWQQANLLPPSTRRPIVTLANAGEARLRGWNAGDRFSFPDRNGQLQYVLVTRNRLDREEIYTGDFQGIVLGG